MIRTLRVYPVLLRAYWQRALIYRAVLLVWIVNAAFPLVMMAIWISLAQDGPIGGYNSRDFVAYYLAAILVRRITGCGIVQDFENLVRTGELSAYLLRPMDIIHHFLARTLTSRALNMPVIAFPIVLVALLVPGQQFDSRFFNIVAFGVSCVIGFAFEFAMQYVIGELSFWISQAHGVNAVFILAKSLLGGYIIPLALFPSEMQAVLHLLPFQSGVALPVEILTGRASPDRILFGLLISALWVFLMGLAGRVLWRLGLRSYTAVGA